jgi:hypothetical protein
MNMLFDYGYQKARQGYPWRKSPPLLPAGEPQQLAPSDADIARAAPPAALTAPALSTRPAPSARPAPVRRSR